MPKTCFTAGQAGAPRWLCIRIGRAAEWVVRQDYCFNRGGCDEFALGGTGVDFFDENFAGSGTTRCRFLSGYLVAHHPLVDGNFISGSCEIKKAPVDPGDDENERFAIPDIITDLPGTRMEYYEVKPNSDTGRAAGRAKIATFKSLIDFLKVTDSTIGQLAKGTQFSPDRTITIYSRLYLGIVPVEVQIHYFLLEPGLIVYEFCVTAQTDLLEALAKAIVVSALIALAYLIFKGMDGIPGELPGGSAPVLADSVGPSGVNAVQDVRYVAALLNDWLDSTGEAVIMVGDTVTAELTAALTDFQSSAGLDDTAGDVTPGDATIVALQQTHLNNVIATADFSELNVEDAGSFIAQESDDLVDTEGGDEVVSATVFEVAAGDYLQAIHDSV